MRPFGEATGWQCPDGHDDVESWSKDFATLCGNLGCDVSAGIDVESFASVVDDTSADGCFCSGEELGTILAARRAAAAATGRHESVTSGDVDTTGHRGPARASPAALEETVDSDSDPADEQLAADLALAITSPDSTSAHPASVRARPQPDAGVRPTLRRVALDDPPVTDPRAADVRRLAERHANEPFYGGWAFVKHMRDTYDLPLRTVLALTLMDPLALRWIQRGATSSPPTASARGQWATCTSSLTWWTLVSRR